MLTTALCFFYLSVRQQQMAIKPKPAPAKPAPNADPLLRAPDAEQVPGDNRARAAEQVAEVTELGKPSYPATTVTLGDPAKGYKLQVTLTSRGAGVEHAELIERTEKGKLRFRALEHDGGYLGYLGLSETLTGLKIRTIPPGSPATVAEGIEGGLQVGDVIVELNGQSVMTTAGLENVLSRTKPGQTAKLGIERAGASGPQSLSASVKLSEAPLDEIRMQPGSSELVTGNMQRPSLMTTLGSLGGTQIPQGAYALPALQETLDMHWETKPLSVEGGEGVEYRLPLDSFLASTGRPSQLDLVKRYRLYPPGTNSDGYLLDLETVIVNRNDREVNVSFRQEGLSGMTLEGWWYLVKISPNFSGAGQRDVIYETVADEYKIASTRNIVDKARKTQADMLADRGAVPPQTPVGMPTMLLSESEPIEVRSLNFIGVDAPYFTAAILPHKEKDQEALKDLRNAAAFSVSHSPESIDKTKLQATNTSFWFETQEKPVPAGGELTRRYQIFIGPKATDVLAAHKLDRAIEYGWFAWVAIPLGGILHFFYNNIVGNFGLAIIMLTVVVRSFLFPFTRKAMISSQKMQEKMKVLQPELKLVNEKYKDDAMKRAKATQDLYAKHKFNPAESLGGCLPMLIQMPIFIGLYRCLSIDIALRQAPLIPGVEWASNLAGPDQLIDWSSWMPDFLAGRGSGWLGPYFNILPMVTVGLFLVQQKVLMPKATDEQTRMTQNMMQVMTIFMGVLFFKVPSGLCIYFITSSVWSLVERQLVKRLMPSPSDAPQKKTESPVIEAKDNKATVAPARSNPKDRRKGQETEQTKPLTRFEEMKRLLEKPAVKSTTQRGSRKDKKRR